MRHTRYFKHSGFTLIEMLVALSLLALITGASYWLINYSVQNYRLSAERASLEQRLHALTNMVADDFSCIVLRDRGFPNFEIKKMPDGMNISFFTSNNAEHITKAVSLILKQDEGHLQSISRCELSAADSLFLQNTLSNEKNLTEIFAKYSPEKTTILCKNLFNFRVRLAIRTASGGIFFSPSNANSVYKQGNLTYKTSDGAADNIRGDLFFVDITVRALPNSCIPKLRKHSQKHHLSLNEIFPNHTCKSFRRIVIKGHYF